MTKPIDVNLDVWAICKDCDNGEACAARDTVCPAMAILADVLEVIPVKEAK